MRRIVIVVGVLFGMTSSYATVWTNCNEAFAEKNICLRSGRAAAIETGAHSALEGGPVGRNLTRRMAAAAVHAGSARLAHKIGQRYAHGAGDMSWLTHKLCHFVLGGTAAELTGGENGMYKRNFKKFFC